MKAPCCSKGAICRECGLLLCLAHTEICISSEKMYKALKWKPPVYRVMNIRYADGGFAAYFYAVGGIIMLEADNMVHNFQDEWLPIKTHSHIDNQIQHCTPPDTWVPGLVVSSDILSAHSIIPYPRCSDFAFARISQNGDWPISENEQGSDCRKMSNVKQTNHRINYSDLDIAMTHSMRFWLSKLKSRSWSMIGSLNRMDFSHCPLDWRSG